MPKHHQEVYCKSSSADRCYYASIERITEDASSVIQRFDHGCTSDALCNDTANFFKECSTSPEACQVQCCSENLCNKVNKEDEPTGETATSNIRIDYILFGVAFVLLVLCFANTRKSWAEERFGVVYKATLKRRQGIEVFDSRKGLEPASKANKEVAVKELQGILSWSMIVAVCMIDGHNVT
ncbi:hypothetical protein OS493_026896 [Desmophyllum pertusum]|uniref:Uncharacterized protein n=1 Tax=Desmophyllum pertusum TaxID=174260 RepID=A0A9X0CW56_9CNID|nr:hypothetical protein OS493_026896 [Desmophyllum pertusum]